MINAPAPPQRQVSPDGQYEWDGQAWLPRQLGGMAPPPPSGKKKGFPVKRVIAGVVALLVMGTCVSAMSNAANSDSKSTAKATPAATAPAKAAGAPVAVAPTTAPKAATPAPPTETASQANARRSAQQYLSFAPFSRDGLIEQLSSSAGEGFPLADATYGVDAQQADWNAQAALSAKQYLRMSAFSRAGLIDQLSSSAGEKFTYDQAVFGVTAAGL